MLTIDGKNYYTSKELSQELKLHPMTIWRWKKAGLVPVHKLITNSKRDYYLLEDILKMTKSSRQNAR